MADVFISYAKTDRPLALKLAAMLEAEGWKTWWDTSLIPGDDFRNEIMTELGRARAVIVIWTDASMKSDWVRSEAGRAQGDRKLIPVKQAHLTYKDLPPPFDVLHTEDIGQEDKIKAAVVAQLAKPAVEPSAWALLGKGFKYEVLTWVGIVGGALTLFGNLDAVLKLADWARVLVQHWKEWTHAFWVWVFGWLGIHLPPEWTPVLSFVSFVLMLISGQGGKTTAVETPDKKWSAWALWIIPPMVVCLGLLPFYPAFAMLVFSIAAPFVMIVLFTKHRLHAALSTCLLVGFSIILAVIPIFEKLEVRQDDGGKGLALIATYVLTFSFPLILFCSAPVKDPKALSRRLIFLALGLLLLISLNELSKLGLDLTAPKLQG